MRARTVIVALSLLGALVLGWVVRDRKLPQSPQTVTAGSQSQPQRESQDEPPPRAQTPLSAPPAAAQDSIAVASDSPIDVAARARFNESAREFFARASQMPPEERMREAERIRQELLRLEQAGGMSAGEIFLLRAGLIRETVPNEAEQAAQIKALQQRYESESQRRMAGANMRPDPAFDLYKVRETEIVAEVMSMKTIPDGLTREEYLRRRLQAAREQLIP